LAVATSVALADYLQVAHRTFYQVSPVVADDVLTSFARVVGTTSRPHLGHRDSLAKGLQALEEGRQ
jgi:hypothetical protein